MGYESRLIFTECHRQEDGTPLTIFRPDGRPPEAWGLVVADIELSKVGGDGCVGQLFSASIQAERVRIEDAEDAYVYGFYEDGNTFLTEDKYDDPVAPVNLYSLRDALMTEIENDLQQGQAPYRRFTLVLAVVNELMTTPRWGINPGGSHRITCLHYGH